MNWGWNGSAIGTIHLVRDNDAAVEKRSLCSNGFGAWQPEVDYCHRPSAQAKLDLRQWWLRMGWRGPCISESPFPKP